MLGFTESYRSPSGRLSRREWLRLGALAGIGLSAAPSPAFEIGERGPGFGRAKSVLLVFANGGQSQIDMWDPKPNAPLDVRGAFAPISTAIPGVQFCEHMPRIARIADRLTVIRSMSHEDLDHGTAAYLALTGVYHPRRSGNPPPSPKDAPTLGAVLRRVRSGSSSDYEAIHLNGPALMPLEPGPGQDGGFLGRAYAPQVVGDPTAANETIPGLSAKVELPPLRLQSRFSVKQSLDRYAQHSELDQRAIDLNRLYSQAFEMLSTPRIRSAFELDAEPAALREHYGRHRSGQAMLLARRLVEAGVPYINVIWNHCNRGQDFQPHDTDEYGWDTHNDIFDALQDRLLPRFDQSFAALIEDLDQRGLLEQTLVVCMGEFGRAPRVAPEPNFPGALPGRKHWASVYSIVMAGAGVGRGQIVGASDRLGGEPITDRYGPWDVAATLFHSLGIDPQSHYSDPLSRPFLIATGRPISAIYSSS